MVKFTDKRSNTYEFNSLINNVSIKGSPFKEIFNNDLHGVKFQEVQLENAFRLHVNVNKVGVFYFYFDISEDKKDIIIEDIRTLKSIEVISLITMMEKVDKLFKIAEKYNLLFALYQQADEFPLDLAICKTLNIHTPLFNIDKNAEPAKEIKRPVREPKEPKQKEEKEAKQKGEGKPFFNKIKDFFSPLKEHKLHFIFSLVAAILVGFTASVGVYNSFAGKSIAIFFFTCALVGAGLNVLINFDTNRKYETDGPFLGLTILDAFVGSLVGMVGLIIFYVTQKDIPSNMPSLFGLSILTIIITVVVMAITMIVGMLIGKNKKK